jgi:hypothetical protein
MKPIVGNSGLEVSLDDLCYMIYQGFGDWAVRGFILDRQRDGHQLSDVRWAVCEPCEEENPVYEEACLICGTTARG